MNVNWSQLEQQKALEEVHSFIQCNNSKSVMVFTDGAVYKGPLGCGACAAVLIPLLGDELKRNTLSVKLWVRRSILSLANLKVLSLDWKYL